MFAAADCNPQEEQCCKVPNMPLLLDTTLLKQSLKWRWYVCCMYVWLAVWHSGRVIWQMNKVTLRQGQLVLGWVTVFCVARQLDQLSQHLCVVGKLI